MPNESDTVICDVYWNTFVTTFRFVLVAVGGTLVATVSVSLILPAFLKLVLVLLSCFLNLTKSILLFFFFTSFFLFVRKNLKKKKKVEND